MTETSTLARDQHEASGTAASHRDAVLSLVRAMPSCTAVELHRWQYQYGYKLERHEISRRLPELRAKGLVYNGESRMCRFSDTRQMTWRLGPKPATQQELF